MEEMGFRKDAPDSVKEAFLKHLIKNTTGVEIQTPTEKKQNHLAESEKIQGQLSFDFMNEKVNSDKKVS